MKKNKLNLLITTLALLFTFPAVAQQTGSATGPSYQPFYYVIGGLLIVIFFMVLTMLRLARLIAEQHYRIIHGKAMETETAVERTSDSWLAKTWKGLTASVPKGMERDVMLDHDYDGIRELDNRMPPWLQYIFVVSVATAIIYILIYHVYNIGMLPLEEYATELQRADDQKAKMLLTAGSSIDESSAKLLTDASSLAAGKTIFIARCAACHGQLGEGGVGPNLTDDYWLHGGSINEVFKVVKYGVPAKGMVSWTGILKPEEMETVSSFILSMQGTAPPNPKAPQGEKYVAKVVAADSTVAPADTAKIKL